MTIKDDFVKLFDQGAWSTATKPTKIATSRDAGGVFQYMKQRMSALIIKNVTTEPFYLNNNYENRIHSCDIAITAESDTELELVKKNCREIVNTNNQSPAAINSTTYRWTKIFEQVENSNLQGGDQGALIVDMKIILGETNVATE